MAGFEWVGTGDASVGNGHVLDALGFGSRVGSWDF